MTRKPGCSECRDRHIRCDRATPSCSNCQKAKGLRVCIYDALKIRHSTYSAASKLRRSRHKPPKEQPPGTLSLESNPVPVFSDDSRPQGQSPFAGTSPFQGRNISESVEGYQDVSVESPVLSWGSQLAQDSSPRGLVNSAEVPTVTSPSSARGFTRFHFVIPFEHTTPDDRRISVLQAQSTGLDSHDLSRRLVTDAVESAVFDFYIKNSGPWLDIVSPARHFGQTVPRVALTSRVLFYACLAYASHVMSLLGEIDEIIEEQYHNKAISILIPLLSSQAAPSKDDALLATTVILRMSEQFSEIGDDAQYHLNGAFSLFGTSGVKWSPFQTDLRGVAFWIYLRESIRVCFLNEQGFQFDMALIEDETTFGIAPDEVWTNRMSLLLARLCNACWTDPHVPARQSRLEELQTMVEEWKRQLPATFQPWCSRQANYEPFPTLRYLSTWHTIAWQQYFTAKVMLAVYTPNRQGELGMLAMNHYMETEVLGPARQACGVCFSCDDIGAGVNGTHLISWCGQYFTGKEEQRRLVNHLSRFMQDTKWPNRTCYERLEKIWSGNRRVWADRP